MAAGRVEPRHADAVAFLHDRHARSDGGDAPDAFMAGNERERGLHRPVAVCGVEIGVADAAGLGLDQDLAGAGRGNVPLPQDQRLSELFDDGGVHFAGHWVFLSSKLGSVDFGGTACGRSRSLDGVLGPDRRAALVMVQTP